MSYWIILNMVQRWMVNFIHWILRNIKKSMRIDCTMWMVFTKTYAIFLIKNVEFNALNMVLMKMLGNSSNRNVFDWHLNWDAHSNCLYLTCHLSLHRMSAPSLPHCKCTSYPPLDKGWEGSAVISHGTLLRFGCLAYVFSVIDDIIEENWTFPACRFINDIHSWWDLNALIRC